jgi:Zn-dependent protease/CBS domain-containing protein
LAEKEKTMFGKRIKLFSLFGFEVKADLSWTIIVVLIVWSLSIGVFPRLHEGLSTRTYWIMGVTGAIGLFLSIIVHEFSHSVVARRQGIPMKGITLFIFGGVAEMGDEPPSPKAEFLMSAAGPISSILIAGLFYGVFRLGVHGGWPEAVNGTMGYLAFINLILAAFNLVPAFPLDGGRILRSGLWAYKGNLRWATRVSSAIGSGFGIFLIIMGVFQVLSGNFVGGMWWFLIGLFVNMAAKSSYQQLLVRRSLEGEPVRRFMKTDPVTVQPSVSVQELVENYIYEYHYKLFPVVENGNKLLGCVTTKQVKEVPKEEWAAKRVRDVMAHCSADNTIEPEADAMKALSLMHRSGGSRLIVADHGNLAGVITLKDLTKFLSLKIELEDH